MNVLTLQLLMRFHASGERGLHQHENAVICNHVNIMWLSWKCAHCNIRNTEWLTYRRELICSWWQTISSRNRFRITNTTQYHTSLPSGKIKGCGLIYHNPFLGRSSTPFQQYNGFTMIRMWEQIHSRKFNRYKRDGTFALLVLLFIILIRGLRVLHLRWTT